MNFTRSGEKIPKSGQSKVSRSGDKISKSGHSLTSAANNSRNSTTTEDCELATVASTDDESNFDRKMSFAGNIRVTRILGRKSSEISAF